MRIRYKVFRVGIVLSQIVYEFKERFIKLKEA